MVLRCARSHKNFFLVLSLLVFTFNVSFASNMCGEASLYSIYSGESFEYSDPPGVSPVMILDDWFYSYYLTEEGYEIKSISAWSGSNSTCISFPTDEGIIPVSGKLNTAVFCLGVKDNYEINKRCIRRGNKLKCKIKLRKEDRESKKIWVSVNLPSYVNVLKVGPRSANIEVEKNENSVLVNIKDLPIKKRRTIKIISTISYATKDDAVINPSVLVVMSNKASASSSSGCCQCYRRCSQATFQGCFNQNKIDPSCTKFFDGGECQNEGCVGVVETPIGTQTPETTTPIPTSTSTLTNTPIIEDVGCVIGDKCTIVCSTFLLPGGNGTCTLRYNGLDVIDSVKLVLPTGVSIIPYPSTYPEPDYSVGDLVEWNTGLPRTSGNIKVSIRVASWVPSGSRLGIRGAVFGVESSSSCEILHIR